MSCSNSDTEPAGGRGGSRHRRRGQLHFFTIAEVADLLEVSTRTVHRWIVSGEIKAHRFGRSVRIAESDLSAFIAQHREG